jgi:hypothetical protein
MSLEADSTAISSKASSTASVIRKAAFTSESEA